MIGFILERVVFLVIVSFAGWMVFRRARRISAAIALGKNPSSSLEAESDGQRVARLRNMLLMAFGQRKMFKRPFPALLHLCVYVGFLLINIEVFEFIVDGLTGSHRIFAPYLGLLYPLLITVFEILAVAVLVACVIFWLRRNVFKIARFWSAEMTTSRRRDANIILIAEIVLMVAILTMDAADQNLQVRGEYPAVGSFAVSACIAPWLASFSSPTLVVVERMAWWFHIVGILGFALYVTYSKHLHIFMAFPATYYARLNPKGYMSNMQAITAEVRSMLGLSVGDSSSGAPPEMARLGAKDVGDLSRALLIGSYACTECGRCTSECPANLTGKKLSPRKIMMDIRHRLDDVMDSLESGGKGLDDGKSLLGNYISREEINACTSCNACVEACPVMLNPLEVILEMRRYIAMEESGAPAQWNTLFQNLETNFAPWKFPAFDRFKWSEPLQVKD